MTDDDWLAERFEADRPHLRGVAYRMLGSLTEADDAVQEAWIRLSRTDTSEVENLRAWLTTVVGASLPQHAAYPTDAPRGTAGDAPAGPDRQSGGRASTPSRRPCSATRSGLALFVVLDALTPAERVAFVLHDVFAVPFDDIAPIVGRTPTATRQLASRARRRVRARRCPTSISMASGPSSMRSWPPHAPATSSGCSPILDPDVVLRSDGGTSRPHLDRDPRRARRRGAGDNLPSVRGRRRPASSSTGSGRGRLGTGRPTVRDPGHDRPRGAGRRHRGPGGPGPAQRLDLTEVGGWSRARSQRSRSGILAGHPYRHRST